MVAAIDGDGPIRTEGGAAAAACARHPQYGSGRRRVDRRHHTGHRSCLVRSVPWEPGRPTVETGHRLPAHHEIDGPVRGSRQVGMLLADLHRRPGSLVFCPCARGGKRFFSFSCLAKASVTIYPGGDAGPIVICGAGLSLAGSLLIAPRQGVKPAGRLALRDRSTGFSTRSRRHQLPPAQ